jgi:hypothetical protein
MIFPGASAALKGYRLQHLYSLFRILGDDASPPRQFQLEGTEDLEIFDDAGRLLEAIQVKARSSAPLTPSALTSRGESFFRRAVERLERDPASRQRVISFGDVGPSLLALASHDEPTDEQRAVLEHLGVPVDRIDAFRTAFDVEQVDEDEIERDVLQRLAETVTAGNPQVAFLYLSGWMFLQMEERRRLTAADVRERLLAVGRFIKEAQVYAEEWFTTIVPLEDHAIDDAHRERLVRDFYEGVSARFEHILAGVDVSRAEKVQEIEAAFQKSNVVIVHGASGQGKTALAYRYLADAKPSTWRFRVRELENIPHARRVALALRSHADAIGVPIIVWLDVTPQDTAWTRVVEELEPLVNTRVLVTIREEDWTRARNAGATLRHADVGLKLDEAEGRGIFEDLQRYRVSQQFLDFEDAWLRFGGRGPLMEFTYLVTQGDALATRLEQQVRRLREEVRVGKMSTSGLELLRRVAVATAAGGRVRVTQIAADLALPEPKTSLERFEREYLLRVSSDGVHAEGLHPLRSATVARLLTSDAAFEPRWLDTAIAVLPAIDESDLESFLLSLFSQPLDHEGLKAALMAFRPRTWSGAAGVVRSLLWCGMHEYTTENAELITEIVERWKRYEFRLAVLDPAGLQTFSPELTESLEQIFSATPEAREWYDDMQLRKPSNACVTRDAFQWLRDAPSFDAPSSSTDWTGMAEVLFWLSASGLASEERAATVVGDLGRAGIEVPLEAAADVLFALSFWDEELLPEQLTTIRRALVDHFRVEQRVFAMMDDGEGMTAHYVISDDAQNLHEETIRRLDLMRRLLPSETAFGAQAHGHIFGTALFPHDPSTKSGVPEHTFPIPWVTRLSHFFSFLAGIRMRGLSWGAYAETIFKMRQMVVMLASVTTEALRKYFNRDKPHNIFEIGVDKVAWAGASFGLKDLPRLPASSVDEWGVELRQKSEVQSVEAKSEHASWERALSDYASSLDQFLENSTPYFLANCHIGRPHVGSDEAAAKALEDMDDPPHTASGDLAKTLHSLRPLQSEFRSRFARFVDAAVLSQLEQDEHERLWTLWAIWFQFADRPRQYLGDARRESLAEASRVLKRRLSDLNRRLASIEGAEVAVHQERGPAEDGQGLWLTMNLEESGNLETARDATFASLVDALRPPPDLSAFDRYVLDLVWQHVHVVPLVRGKSLARTFWTFSIAALPQPDGALEAWQYIERPVDLTIWNQLRIESWPETVGGPARRVHAHLIAVSVLLEQYVRLEDAPEPDAIGRSILTDYWEHLRGTLAVHARGARAAAAECPLTLFKDREESRNNLKTYCDFVIDQIDAADAFAFEALKKLNTSINESVSGMLATLVHVAIDNELARQLDSDAGR